MPDEKVTLHYSAGVIAKELNIAAMPVVISHACVSGVVALTYAARMLQAGRYKNAIVVGCDRFSKFVLNGFQSFHAIAPEPCRPFDADRKGVNLGEAGAAIILSTEQGDDVIGEILGGATSNDANHISGPSRTGEELADAINRAMNEAGISAKEVDMISAHGTATPYNDEMEAKAFDVAHLLNSPLHSLKGYIGHTLGAAGIIESVMILESMRQQQLIPSIGYENLGVPKPVKVTTAMQPATLKNVLKTASGFGGSNAAMVWRAI
jgi:3-oxoacyl-[acyl-carrier-protein] synthase-1